MRRSLLSCSAALIAAALLGGPAAAQPTFSVDVQGPTVGLGLPDGFFGVSITDGDILTNAVPGPPGPNPGLPGPLPPPGIEIGAVTGALGVVPGGLGIVPLRSSIFWVNEHRPDYGDVSILYGAHDPSQLLFAYQYQEWHKVYNLRMLTIVEEPDKEWDGPVGLITKLFDDVPIDPNNTYAIVCGPPVMFKSVCTHLSELGLPRQRMYVSLERRMHCGMGKCCRCNVGSTFTCLDGPVFDYWSVMNLQEAI